MINNEGTKIIEVNNQNNFANEDNFFINAAWVNAIKTEMATVDDAISKNLNGKDYSQMEKELADIDIQEKQANDELQNLDKKSLTSEEYYKKRRELDILKIEKENLEYTFNNNASSSDTAALESQLAELTGKIAAAEETRSTLPFIIYSLKEGLEELVRGLDYKGQIIALTTLSASSGL